MMHGRVIAYRSDDMMFALDGFKTSRQLQKLWFFRPLQLSDCVLGTNLSKITFYHLLIGLFRGKLNKMRLFFLNLFERLLLVSLWLR